MPAAQLAAFPQNYEEKLTRVIQQLARQGLQVVRSFELQTTNAACGSNQCPSCGPDPCQCQLTVLLIYESSHPPLTVLAHRRSQQTWFSLVDTPQRAADPELEALITTILAQECNTQAQLSA